MGMEEFIPYRTFDDSALAGDFIEFLKINNISYSTETYSTSPNPLDNVAFERKITYVVKIAQSDFERVNQLEINDEQTNAQPTEPDHYLFSFSDNELKELLINSEDWNAGDVVLAKQILSQRDITFSETELTQAKQAHCAKLIAPTEHQTGLITIGYILAFLGGFAGVFIGWYLKTNKRVLPNGDQVYTFSENDRKSGNNILIFGCVMFVILTLCRILL